MKSYILIILIVLTDQISKILIKLNLVKYQTIGIFGDFFKFTYVENQGIAFGIDTSGFHLIIVFLTVFAILGLFYYRFNVALKYERFPLIFIIGGAIGNAIDRVLVLIPSLGYRGVIDFIDIGIGHYRWFIFNLADTSITIGVILYFILHYNFNKKNNAISRDI